MSFAPHSVAECVAQIIEFEAVGRGESSYRGLIQINDYLMFESSEIQIVRTVDEPAVISPKWDAAIAGVVEWRLSQMATPLPAWVTERQGEPNWRWHPHPEAHRWIPEPDLVPEPLRRRGIYIERGELASV